MTQNTLHIMALPNPKGARHLFFVNEAERWVIVSTSNDANSDLQNHSAVTTYTLLRDLKDELSSYQASGYEIVYETKW